MCSLSICPVSGLLSGRSVLRRTDGRPPSLSTPCTREPRTETDHAHQILMTRNSKLSADSCSRSGFLLRSLSSHSHGSHTWGCDTWDGEAYGHLMSESTVFLARLPRLSQVSALRLRPQTRSWVAPLPGPCSYHTGVSSAHFLLSSHLWTCSKLFLKRTHPLCGLRNHSCSSPDKNWEPLVEWKFPVGVGSGALALELSLSNLEQSPSYQGPQLSSIFWKTPKKLDWNFTVKTS